MLYNWRLSQLEQILADSKNRIRDGYQEEKLTQTKDGLPVYLIHVSVEDDLGNIHVLTTGGLDGHLQYLVGGNSSKYLRICDTKHQALNQGIGSEILQYLEEVARQKQCDRIIGWLSPIDLNDHGDRLLHWCDKNGYQITEEKTPYSNMKGLYATKYFRYA